MCQTYRGRKRVRAFTSSSHSRLQCLWFTSKCCRPGLFWQRGISEYLRYVFNICMLGPKALWNSNQSNHWEMCCTAGSLAMHSGGESRRLLYRIRTSTRLDQSRKSEGFSITLILFKVTLWKFWKVLPTSQTSLNKTSGVATLWFNRDRVGVLARFFDLRMRNGSSHERWTSFKFPLLLSFVF